MLGKHYGENHVSYYYSKSVFSPFYSSPFGPVTLLASIVSRPFYMLSFPHFLFLLCLFKSHFFFRPWQLKFSLKTSSSILGLTHLTPSPCYPEFPVSTSLAQTVKSLCNAGDLGSIPGLGRSSGEGNGYSLVFLPGKSHGQRSLVGYSP